jgi:excisionase family DNA binding protein
MSREHRLPPLRWITTAEAAAQIGVSQWWIRQRIEDALLPATAITTGRHKIYRIRDDDWAEFRARFTGDALDPRFH